MDELNPALGLWVVQEGPNVYSTSALLHQLGSGLLPPTKAHVHLALGRAILKKRRLSMADGMQAFRHLFAAGDREQPPRILLKALKAFVESPRPVLEDHWGFTLIWVDHALPSYIPLPMRLLLRAYQVVARHRHGDSTTFLFHDLDLLLEQATSERLNDVVAATTGLVTVEIGRDYPSKSNEYILKMLNLLPTVKLPHGSMKPSDSSRAPISGEVGPESLLWVTASGIKNPTELADWLATVSKLTEEQRKRLFASSLSGLQTFFLCHSIWDRERIKPPNLQDWQSVLSQLLAVESLARSTDNELLLGSAVRARITTLGEFLNDADQVQSVASEAYSSVQPHGSAALLISEAAARVLTLRKKSFEAKEWALRAVIAEAGEFGLIKRDALLLLSRLLLPTEASAASEYCRQAVELVRSGTPYDATSLAQTLGEYSIVLWDSDSFDQSLLALQEAVSILLEGKTETPLLKRLYVLCGHTAGYMASMAQFGAPPTADYVAPIPGMFLAARGASSDP